MVSSPAIRPVTTPAILTDARLLADDHTPPEPRSVSTMLDPAHNVSGPETGLTNGKGITVRKAALDVTEPLSLVAINRYILPPNEVSAVICNESVLARKYAPPLEIFDHVAPESTETCHA